MKLIWGILVFITSFLHIAPLEAGRVVPHNSKSFMKRVGPFFNERRVYNHPYMQDRDHIRVSSLLYKDNWPFLYTANILTVLSSAFGSVTFPTVIWLYIVQSKTVFDLKRYSSISVIVICTVIGCNNQCQITVGNITQPMTVNWL